MHLTEKEARALGIPVPTKKSKYNSNNVWVDGICFASQAEADYYCILKIRQRAGEIIGFCRQPRFVVTEGVDRKKRGTEYVADFVVFFPDGRYEIIDVKGAETESFKLKLKSFYEKYPKLKVVKERISG